MYRYSVLLEYDEDDDGYVVSVPSLPGCFTQGKTIDQALERAHEAIRCHIRGLLLDGDEVPIEHTPPILASVTVSLPHEIEGALPVAQDAASQA